MAIVDLRYARALEQVVDEQKLDPAAVQQQLADFAALLASSSELYEVLDNPAIPEAQKVKVLDAIAARTGMHKVVRNVLAVITHHQRLGNLDEIVAAYASLADQETGVAEAEIVSARPLDEASRTLLESQVAKIAGGQKIRATYSEDASLLGGAVVRVGSTVYDGSVRTQLEKLKQRMVEAGA